MGEINAKRECLQLADEDWLKEEDIMVRIALILTRDNSGIGSFAKELVLRFGYELLALQETAELLENIGVKCEAIDLDEGAKQLSSKEDFPELLVANYFDVASVSREFMSWKSAWKSFDFEIVDCIRMAAKRPSEIAIFGDSKLYPDIVEELGGGKGVISQPRKIELASKALGATAEFDAAIATFLETQATDVPDLDALSGYPKSYRLNLIRARSLSEGVNRFQKASLYGSFFEHFEQVGGPELDYNSIAEVSFGAFLIGEFEKPAAAIVRNGNIVAVACDSDESKVFEKLDFETLVNDVPGLALITNQSVDAKNAQELNCGFAVILAPRFDDEAIAVFENKVRLLIGKEGMGYDALYEHRDVVGGMLIQDRDRSSINPFAWQAEGPVQPLVDQWEDLLFAAKVCRHARSSAIVAVRGEKIVSISAGANSQTDAMRLLEMDTNDLSGCVIAMDESISDPKVLSRARKLGIAGVVHPGKEQSIRAAEVGEAIMESGLVVMATGRGQRKF